MSPDTTPPRWRDQWPEEQRKLAWKLVTEAIKSGELVRQPCRICGEPYSIAHHENYEQPLVIDWLCGRHHGKTPFQFGLWIYRPFRRPSYLPRRDAKYPRLGRSISTVLTRALPSNLSDGLAGCASTPH